MPVDADKKFKMSILLTWTSFWPELIGYLLFPFSVNNYGTMKRGLIDWRLSLMSTEDIRLNEGPKL